jgi:ankyrin repeat protein
MPFGEWCLLTPHAPNIYPTHTYTLALNIAREQLNVNIKAANGSTPLHFAAGTGHTETVIFFCKRVDGTPSLLLLSLLFYIIINY